MIKFETINGTLCRMVEPEPEYKVGDWVADNHNQHYRVSEVDGDAVRIDTDGYDWFSAETGWYIPDGQTRGWKIVGKVKPSEVKVKITLKGTVSQDRILYGASCFTLKTGRSEYIISLHEIEEDELVESLLKAQEEK